MYKSKFSVNIRNKNIEYVQICKSIPSNILNAFKKIRKQNKVNKLENSSI